MVATQKTNDVVKLCDLRNLPCWVVFFFNFIDFVIWAPCWVAFFILRKLVTLCALGSMFGSCFVF